MLEELILNGEPAPTSPDLTKERVKSGRPYSQDLRSRVIIAVEAGASYRQAAAQYGVSASAALKWVQRFRQTGSVTAKPMGGHRRSRLEGEREWLLRRVAADPDLTLVQLHEELCARGIQVGSLTLQRFLKNAKIEPRKERARRTHRPPKALHSRKSAP